MDLFDLQALEERFDTVIDSGVFHVFEGDDRRRAVEALRDVLTAGGRCHLLCFSDRAPGGWPPHRISKHELRNQFCSGWVIESLGRSVFELRGGTAAALLARLRRL